MKTVLHIIDTHVDLIYSSRY